jgi:CheY-like chemotaxis protein
MMPINTYSFIIADDNDVDRFLHAKIVSELGHKVKALASDGVELLHACETFLPDFILTDTVMPKLDGIDACKKVKQLSTNIRCIS